MRKNSNKLILFIHMFKDIGKIYRDVRGYDMSYDEDKKICKKSWEDEYIYLCIDNSKKRDQGRYCVCSESKNTNIECTPETKAF